MKCPLCNGKLKIIESRQCGERKRRIRECLDCLSRYPTYEMINVYEWDPYIRVRLERKKAL